MKDRYCITGKKNTVVRTVVKENKELIRLKEAEKCRSV